MFFWAETQVLSQFQCNATGASTNDQGNHKHVWTLPRRKSNEDLLAHTVGTCI
jgi:hypothetical protein